MTAPSATRSTGQITIRDVPTDILDDLRREAKESGRSMSAVVRAALAEHVERHRWRQRIGERLPELDAFSEQLARQHGGPFQSSVPLIREDRAR